MDKYVEYVVNNLTYAPENKAFPFIDKRGGRIGSVGKSQKGRYQYTRTELLKKVFNMAQVSWMHHHRERLSSKEIINIDGDAFNNTIENLSKCFVFDEVTPKTLSEMFDYDPTNRTNPLVLKVDLDKARRKGDRLGFFAGNGKYQFVGLNGVRYSLASLIWMHQTGETLDGKVVDHIDHDPTNNTIENLRAATQEDNTKNRRLSSNNKSGYHGVFYNKGKNRWYAFGYEDKKQVCLGSSRVKDEAVALREAWERTNKFHPNHGA